MNEWEAHFRTGEEALDAALALRGEGRLVPAAFFACHAFEMSGSAFIVFVGGEPSGNHGARCRQFAAVAGRYGFGHGVGVVSYEAASLRNRCLYAGQDPSGVWDLPSQRVDPVRAARLVNRVRGIVGVVRQQLP